MGKENGGTKLRDFGPRKSPLLFQVGRVCTINYGVNSGKICIVIDIVDTTQALVDGPQSATGVARQTMPFARLSCLPIRVKCVRACSSSKLAKIFSESDVAGKWAKLPWAKKLEKQKKRANLTDFDRFKVLVLRKKRSALVQKELQQLKKLKYFEGRYNKNGKGKTLSKRELYWQAKKEGKDAEYPARKKRDAKKIISSQKKKRTRTRSKKRSKKRSQAKLDARVAYRDLLKRKHKETALKVSPEDKQKDRKKVDPERKSKKKVLPKDPKEKKAFVQKTKAAAKKAKHVARKQQLARRRAKNKAKKEYYHSKKASAGDKTSKRKK